MSICEIRVTLRVEPIFKPEMSGLAHGVQSNDFMYEGAVPYEVYAPAYRYGWESRSQYASRPYDEIEPELERTWEDSGRAREMEWERARPAVRDAWDRIGSRYPDESQEY